MTLCDVGIVGATGQVGRVMAGILAERGFPIGELRLFASAESAGRTAGELGVFERIGRGGVARPPWADDSLVVEDADAADYGRLSLVLMSAGNDVSHRLSPKIAAQGAVVVDNSCAWRGDPEVPLVVSEVNPQEAVDPFRGIVANPNCTTMIAMPVLAPLHVEAGLVSMVASTYQAVSGAGAAGSAALADAVAAAGPDGVRRLVHDGGCVEDPPQDVFAAPIAFNAVAIAGSVCPDGSGDTSEERKLREESRRILGIPSLAVSATCVRVPVATGHSIALTLGFERPMDPARAEELLAAAAGVELCGLPDPRSAAGRDDVLVGRVRKDAVLPNGLSLFVSGDNLRKGAALNAVQIAELLAAARRR